MRKCPTWLCKTGKAYWKVLAPMVDLSDDSKAETLSLLCDHYATYRQASEIIQKEGLIALTSVGGSKEHPAVNIRNKASDQIQKLSKLLNLYEIKEALDDDPLDDLIGG